MTDQTEIPQELLDRADATAKFIADRMRELVDYCFRPGFEFALIINDPTREHSMAIFSELDTKEQLTALLRLAYTRHNDGSMHEGGELKNPKNTH